MAKAIESRQIAIARVRLEQAKVDAHEIRAPFDGTVIRIDTQVGERTATGKNLILLANHDLLHIEMFVPAKYFSVMQIGDVYELWADPPVAKTIKGRWINQEPIIEPATSTVRCVFVVSNSDHSLPAGVTARLHQP